MTETTPKALQGSYIFYECLHNDIATCNAEASEMLVVLYFKPNGSNINLNISFSTEARRDTPPTLTFSRSRSLRLDYSSYGSERELDSRGDNSSGDEDESKSSLLLILLLFCNTPLN